VKIKLTKMRNKTFNSVQKVPIFQSFNQQRIVNISNVVVMNFQILESFEHSQRLLSVFFVM